MSGKNLLHYLKEAVPANSAHTRPRFVRHAALPCASAPNSQTLWVRPIHVPQLLRRTAGLFSLVALTAGCGGADEDPAGDPLDAFDARPTTDDPGARRFLVVARPGEIPGVADQPTARGLSIATLAPFGSRLFLGYGDFSDNTGPISPVAYDVESGHFDAGSPLETEELLDFQVHAGHLFAAELDPRGDETLGSVFRFDLDTGWRAMPDIPDAVHTFGMAEFSGQLFVGTGCARGGTARIAVTSDGGETWRDSHTAQAIPGAYARYTQLGATSSQLFVSGRIHTEPSAPFAYAWSSADWEAVSGLPGDGLLIPLVLGDELVLLQFSGDRGKGGRELASYRLEAQRLVPREPLVAGETLVNWSQERSNDAATARTWVLTERNDGTQSIYLAESSTRWQLVRELPTLPNHDVYTSIAYLDDTLYLGTANGGLCAVEEVFALVSDS